MYNMAKQGMDNDETSFSTEQDLGEQTLLWSDKYRPQKPKYFNRVHTGFDWNKYNQTHYDVDNPPPKIVQGYRFNVSTACKFMRSFRSSIRIYLTQQKRRDSPWPNVKILNSL